MRTSRRIALHLLAVTMVSALPAVLSAAELASLSWMSGSWGGTQGPLKLEEHWSTPAGGLMVCMHKDVRDGKAVSFEFLRIVQRGDSLVFVALPRGRNETPFPMKEMSDRRVVFENLEHDFPQRVLYWSDRKGTLSARVEGTIDGKAESEQWTWRPVKQGR